MVKHTADRPTVAAIIPVRNDPGRLDMCLRSLVRQTSLPEEIICVDDASEAQAYRDITRLCRRLAVSGNVRIELLQISPGNSPLGRRSLARTIGSKVAQSEVLMYIDQDMMLGPEHVAEIRRYHAADQRALVKGPRCAISPANQQRGTRHCLWIVSGTTAGPPALEYVGYLPRRVVDSALDSAVSPLGDVVSPASWHIPCHRIFKPSLQCRMATCPADYGLADNWLPYSHRWDWCASNNLSVRRREVERIGWWDDRFVGWGEEDMDFAYRLYVSGCRPVLPQGGAMCAYHLDHEVDREDNLHSLRHNAAYFVRKFPIMALYRAETYKCYGLEPKEIQEWAAVAARQQWQQNS